MGKCCSRPISEEEAPLLQTQNQEYSFIVHEPQREGEGRPRATQREFTTAPPDATTLHENFLHGHRLANFGQGAYLGFRPEKDQNYVWITYNQVYTRMRNFGSGLVKMLPPGAVFGIYSSSRPEWIIAEQTCYMYNYITVPIHESFKGEQLQYILRQTELSIILTTSDKAMHILDLQESLPMLKTIIVVDMIPRIVQEQAHATKIKVITMRDIEKQGRDDPLPKRNTTADDTASICFTSGTLSNPKGVVLTHRNIMSFVGSICKRIEEKQLNPILSQDIHFSYVSHAQVFERLFSQILTYHGSKIGFFCDNAQLFDDMILLKPTIVTSIPRFYNKLFQSITTEFDKGGTLKRYLFKKAYQSKLDSLGRSHHPLWDLFFRSIRKRLGGKVRMMVSAESVAPHIADFMRICFSSAWFEGYTSTETGVVTLTLDSDKTHGHVGVPLANCMVKLKDVPELGYVTGELKGEIFVKGANVFQEYFKDKEATTKVKNDDWCATGDIGMWDDLGRLKIIARLESIFRLSNKVPVLPEKIERIYEDHQIVNQCFVYGDSSHHYLVAVVIVNDSTLEWAQSQGFKQERVEDLISDSDFGDVVLQSLEAFGKRHGLKDVESIKKCYLDTKAFTEENGLLTATGKLKRVHVATMFKDILNQLYNQQQFHE